MVSEATRSSLGGCEIKNPPDPPSLCVLRTHCADSLHLPPLEQNSEKKPLHWVQCSWILSLSLAASDLLRQCWPRFE